MTTARLRAIPRGTLVLTVAIVLVFAAVASNIPETVHQSHQSSRDRAAFVRWTATHGGRRSYGVGIAETHSRYDVVCAVHFPNVLHRHHADYRVKLLIDSHGPGTPRVLRAVHVPVKIVPTATGTKCGAVPPAP